MKLLKRYFIYFIISALFVYCARISAPSGGDKDETPPVLKVASPPSGTTQFKGNRIRLYFDEYITLKDIRKQLIISPPMNTFPEITPMGNASKFIDIKILDTLLPNTTYSLNFGNSIQDYNEGNPIPFFKYVFSTGEKIDSLSVKGTILDAYQQKTDNFVSVMLYPLNEKYTDSIIYKDKPMYVTNTLDSLKTFEITNVKEGKYMLVAMKDKANNYLFNPKDDKIAFLKTPIEVPSDSLYELRLFKEIPNNRTARAFQSGEKRISISYEGERDSLKINILPPTPKDFSYIVSKEKEKDTLHFWFSPKIDDSLRLAIKNQKIDTFRILFRKMKSDSLQISSQNKSISPTQEIVTFSANIPVSFNAEKVKITADSLNVDFKNTIDSDKLNVELHIATKPATKYQVVAYPEAFVDFYGKANDTIKASFSSKAAADFSTFKLHIQQKVKYPILIELTNAKGETQYQKYLETPENQCVFDFIKAGKYFIRIVEDENKNKRWDTGNYLKKIPPERTLHFPKEIDLRPNWEITETF